MLIRKFKEKIPIGIRILLNWILKQNVRERTGFNCFRIG
jgi:hypothetical protein